jgi:branched-chain amino acid transport system substrate-binding protein
MKGKRILSAMLVILLIAGMGLLAASCDNNASSNMIKIGAIMPMTGDVSLYGTGTVNSINIAIKEINDAGGIDGKKLQLIVEDDENKPEKSVDAYNKLVTKDKVDVIIGCLTSKCSLAVAPLAQADKIPMITTSSTNYDVTQAGDYIFRTCYIDPFQGTVCANFASKSLEKGKAAIVFDNGNDYSKGLATEFEKAFVANGGTIVAKEAYSLNDQDFSAILTKIKETQPDVLFIPDYYSKVSLIAKQVRSLGMTDLVMLGGDGWDEIANNAGDEVLGCYYINHFAADSTETLAVEFVNKYKAAYNNETPNALAVLGYDALKILAAAIDKADSTDKAKVRDAIAQTNGTFLTGSISFDENRNPVKGAVILTLEKVDGKLVAKYFETVNP